MLNVEFTYSAGLSSQLRPDDRPDIVFSGRSNVGKSSLINKLCNRKSLARVSSKPGKTATINFFDGGTFNLVDLPGYGYAKVSKVEKLRWAELVEGYFAAGRDIALVVQIIDMRHKPSADDMNMVNFLYDSGIPFIIVMTKSDKLNKSEYAAQLEQMTALFKGYEGVELYPFSALKGDGAQPIDDAIMAHLS
jgi:GTP-binding protein